MSPSDLKKFLLQHFQHLELGDSSNRNAEIACTKLLLLNLDGIVLVTPRRYYSPFLRCLLRQLNCSVQNTAVTMQCIVLLYLHDNPLFYGRASSWPSLQQQLIWPIRRPKSGSWLDFWQLAFCSIKILSEVCNIKHTHTQKNYDLV